MLEARRISVSFRRRDGSKFKALDEVSISVPEGKIVGLVGESGSGKTTLVRTLCGLQRPDSGEVTLDGHPLAEVLDGARKKRWRKEATPLPISMVFQDATGALDPHQTAKSAVAEALRVHRVVPQAEIDAEANRLLRIAGLPADVDDKRPCDMSGGQCQRVCIARAIAPRPTLLIGDEPVSALDVSVQARILKLLAALLASRENGLRAMLIVTHDLAVVSTICDYAYVLDAGRVAEAGEPRKLFASPQSAATRHLLDAAIMKKDRE